MPNSAPHDGGEVARRTLAVGQQLQDPAADRLAQDVERVHERKAKARTNISQDLCNSQGP